MLWTYAKHLLILLYLKDTGKSLCIINCYFLCPCSAGTHCFCIIVNEKLINLYTIFNPSLCLFQHFLGYYYFSKSKTLQDKFCPGGVCAAMFVLLVNEELQSWPEQSTRQRSWLTIPEATDCCRHPWMRKALEEGFSKWHADQIISKPKEKENNIICIWFITIAGLIGKRS